MFKEERRKFTKRPEDSYNRKRKYRSLKITDVRGQMRSLKWLPSIKVRARIFKARHYHFLNPRKVSFGLCLVFFIRGTAHLTRTWSLLKEWNPLASL